MLTAEKTTAVNRRLSAIFQNRWTSEQGQALFDEFQDLISDELFIEAIRRHLHDPAIGQYPPKPADIERHLQALYVEQDEQQADQIGAWFAAQVEQAEEPPVKPSRPVTLSTAAQLIAQASEFERVAEQWRRERQQYLCYDCANTGIAHFWWDGQDRKNVWTRYQYMSLTDTEKEELRVEKALCSCVQGEGHPYRSRKVEIGSGPYDSRTRTVALWPCMKTIRLLAGKRIQEKAA